MAMSEFPNEKEKILGYVEAIMGFGCVVGPIVGSTFYSFLGFAGAFYLVGSLILAYALTSILDSSKKVREP